MEKSYQKMKVKELKALAKERGIKGYYRLRKAELIEILGIQAPTDAPATIIDEPVTVMDEPEPEIKKPVLSPTKMKNISRVSSSISGFGEQSY